MHNFFANLGLFILYLRYIDKHKIVMIKSTVLLFILLFSSSCTNLFSTRDDQVEEPDPSTISQVFEEPTEPAIVMVNLSRAIEGANTVEYAKLFSNPNIVSEKHFRFIGDANFSNQFIGSWTYSEEQNYFLNMVQIKDNTKPVFRFSFEDSLPSRLYSALDSVETDFMEYKLEIILPDTEKVYFGFSNFKLFKSATANEAWYIYSWEDRAKNESFEQSWTALKVRNQ